MYRMTRRILFVVACLALATAASAQQLGSVAGVVKDASGAVLPGVTVEVASPALIEKVRTAVTDGSGQYRIVNLPPGVYTVTLHADGFQFRPPRRCRSVGRRELAGERRAEGRRRGRNHHRHRRSAGRRHSVGRADALGDGTGIQGTALGRVVDPDGGARAGRPGVKHRRRRRPRRSDRRPGVRARQ